MKKIQTALFILLVGFVANAHAAVVTFEWAANTESDLAGYRIYKSTVSGQYVYGPSNAAGNYGKVTTGTVNVTGVEGDRFYFVLTAYDTSGNESLPSNEVSYVVPDTTPPAAPKGLMMRLLQSFLDWWNNRGFRIS
jgi:hypothetical protein